MQSRRTLNIVPILPAPDYIVDLSLPTPLAEPRQVGRKASTLQLLFSAHVPVPPAFAISWQHLADGKLVAGALQDLQARCKALGPVLAVRSSANIEDLPDAAAPGLFESVVPVLSDAAERAIETVWASARTPLVAAYLRARSIHHEPHVSIIVQRYIEPTIGSGVLYTRRPGFEGESEALLEKHGCPPITIHKEHEVFEIPAGAGLSADQAFALWHLALRVEQALASDTGLDIEWVWGAEGPCIVQARPIVAREVAGPDTDISALTAFSRAEPERIWILDASHNPAPLSPAQAGLVEYVNDLAPYDARIVGGYLYTSSRRHDETPSAMSRSELERLYHEEILPAVDQALAGLEGDASVPSLESALSAYREVFDLYVNRLGPALRGYRLQHADEAANRPGENPLTHWLRRAQAGLISREELFDRIAAMAPAWDVAVPTYGETPESVERALELLPEPGVRPAATTAAFSVAESDDLLFFRAQRCVRRALLALAESWGLSAQEIFYVPLGQVLAAARKGQPTADFAQRARQLLERSRAQSQREMPLTFANGQVFERPLPADEHLWKGLGTGGYAEGVVLRVADLAEIPKLVRELPTVLVMPTVSPAHALAAVGAAALVCEYGEHLGHGAAMARELQIPCVVGCHRVWRDLRTGDRVAVHGQAGLVARLATRPD